jgi:hypothetical protein
LNEIAPPRQLNRYTLALFVMASDTIVETIVDCVSPTGERHSVTVEIGRPYKTDGPWACPVTIRGLYDRLPDVCGEDSLQALCLAASLVRSLLTGVIENGGRLMYPHSDSAFDLNATFGGVGQNK